MLKTILKTSGYVACLLISGVASAVGLGGISVSSNLGQPLKAEIELVAVDKADRSGIVAKLASVEAFKAAGIDYPYALPKLKFNVTNRDSAQPRIRITSVQPVNEPFVTLLVEVVWSSGKLVREYTFLLDPDGFAVAPQVETVKPVAPVVSVPSAPSVALPVVEAVPEPTVAPIVPAAAAPVQAAAEPTDAEPAATEQSSVTETPPVEEVATLPAEPEEQEAPVVVEDALSKEEAIPVAEPVDIKVVRGDSLSKIALKVKPADVSLERMLVAMYRANSTAFTGKNMNRLQAGKIIRVPDAAEIEAVEQSEAVSVYRAQVEDWNAYRQQLAAVRAEAREQTAQQATSGKVTAAVTEKAASKDAPAEVLKLSKGETPGDAVAGASASSKEEDSVAKTKALKEAQERTALLEKNVKDLERLAELKKQQTIVALSPAPESAVATATIGASAPAPAQPVAKPAVPAPVEVPQAEASFMDSLLEDPVLLGGAGAGLIVLLGAGFWLSRRRAAPAPKRVATVSSDAGDVGSSTGRIAEPVMPSPDTGDFTRQDEEGGLPQSSDEVNPVAEADLFLSFGRDAQAEEVLKEALNSKPGDVPIITKLLSIYSRRKDANAFITYARQIKDSGDEAAWLQVAAMGRELEPGNAFYGGEGVSSETTATHEVKQTEEQSVDFDLGFGNSATEAEKSAAVDTLVVEGLFNEKPAEVDPIENFMGTVVMSQESLSNESTAKLTAEEMQSASASSMDFDITGTHPGQASAQFAAPDETGNKASEASDDLIFDVTSTHPGVPSQMATTTKSTEQSAAPDDLVFDVTSTHSGFQTPFAAATSAEPAASAGLDDLMFDITSAQPEETAPTKAEVSAAADGLAFTLDMPKDFKSVEEQPSAPMDIGLGDISLNMDGLSGGENAKPAGDVQDDAWQEVTTKLDLARAYQEMGDVDGAKEILEEVLRDGDEQQRASAQSILNQL